MLRAGVPKDQAMPAPPASSWEQGKDPWKGLGSWAEGKGAD